MYTMCVIDVLEFSDEKGIKIIHINTQSLLHKVEDIFSNFNFCDVIIVMGSQPLDKTGMRMILRKVEVFVYMLKVLFHMKFLVLLVL